MKNLLFCALVAMMIAVSCNPKYGSRIRHTHFITNETGKVIIHELSYFIDDNGNDTLRFVSDGTTDSTMFEKSFGTPRYSEPNEKNIIYSDMNLYCLSDTTYRHWAEWDENNAPIKIVQRGPYTAVEGTKIWYSDYYLTINDSLLGTMQKDYSMLEKFPEYYGD
jgi:hypothetical protein